MSGTGNSGNRRESLVSQTVDTDTTTAGGAQQLPSQASNKFLVFNITTFTLGSFTPTIQHSLDGTVWSTLIAGSAMTAAGAQAIPFPATGNLPFVRTSVLSGSSADGVVNSVFTYANPTSR